MSLKRHFLIVSLFFDKRIKNIEKKEYRKGGIEIMKAREFKQDMILTVEKPYARTNITTVELLFKNKLMFFAECYGGEKKVKISFPLGFLLKLYKIKKERKENKKKRRE